MRTKFLCLVCIAVATALTAVQGMQQVKPGNVLPSLKRQATPKAVVDEHLDALNRCDWTRLMAQYPSDVEIFLPGGQVVKGRQAVGELFAGFVKPFKDGGLCGLTFVSEHVQNRWRYRECPMARKRGLSLLHHILERMPT